MRLDHLYKPIFLFFIYREKRKIYSCLFSADCRWDSLCFKIIHKTHTRRNYKLLSSNLSAPVVQSLQVEQYRLITSTAVRWHIVSNCISSRMQMHNNVTFENWSLVSLPAKTSQMSYRRVIILRASTPIQIPNCKLNIVLNSSIVSIK